MSINCHRTCINCNHNSSYLFYCHSMAISLRILYTWTSQYKTVHHRSYYSMTFHDVVYCDMYSLVPWHGSQMAGQSAGQLAVHLA